MPRTCTVCQHEDRADIDSALLAGEPLRNISKQFDLGHTALHRHKQEGHIHSSLLKAREARELADAERLTAELEAAFSRVNKLFDACDEWLTDPDDPTRYDIGPRAHEIKVTYEDGGKPRKASLQELLDLVEDDGRRVVTMVETKSADPRELLLKTAQRLQGQLELVAKLIGELNDNPQINLTIAPEWLELRAVIVGALDEHPEAQHAVLQAIEGAEVPAGVKHG